jgi:quinol monooxygenase YgiN
MGFYEVLDQVVALLRRRGRVTYRALKREFQGLREVRRRDGALAWSLYRDPAEPGRYVEVFIVESWVEHLRQHERITTADRALEERARRFHRGSSPPTVTHLIASRPGGP